MRVNTVGNTVGNSDADEADTVARGATCSRSCSFALCAPLHVLCSILKGTNLHCVDTRRTVFSIPLVIGSTTRDKREPLAVPLACVRPPSFGKRLGSG